MLGLLEDYEKFVSEIKVYEYEPEEKLVEGVVGSKPEPISLLISTQEEDKEFKNLIDTIITKKPEYMRNKEETLEIGPSDEKVAENIYTKILKLEFELKNLEKSTEKVTSTVSSSFNTIENMMTRAKTIKTHIESFKDQFVHTQKSEKNEKDTASDPLLESKTNLSVLTNIQERITRLENFIGYKDDIQMEKSLFYNKCTNIKEILEILVKKLELMDESTLLNVKTLQNEIILNINALNSDYNNELVLTYGPKLDETYKKVTELISISDTLPPMISHLKSIHEFLVETSEMFGVVKNIKKTQEILQAEIDEQRTLLNNLEKVPQ